MARLEAARFAQLAEDCLQRAGHWLEAFDPDEVDYTTGDGKLQLEFPDGVRFVLNRQGAASQMWFAAVDRAWHYDWDATTQRWVDDRDGHELFANLATVVGRKLGRAVSAP